MSRYHLSVLIPARNEYYHDIDLLYETVTNVLANTSAKTQIVVVCDGYWPKQPLPVNSRLTVIHHNQSIGQRAATNEAARVAQGEYVMKLDGHCALSPNFDEALLAHFPDNWTVIPSQYNLLVFTWKCKKCGWQKDQSPKPEKCDQCGSQFIKQVKHWFPRDGREGSDVSRPSGKRNTLLRGWRFDTNLEYQQMGALFDRQKDEPYPATMSLLGACWAMKRNLYFQIEPCDTSFGNWGQMGTEIACKVWLSGNELRVNPNCWFAHFFRVGGIGFPWPDGGRKERAMVRSRELWLGNTWPKQVYPLSWLIERFRPLPDWHTDNNPVLTKVIEAGKKFKPSPVSSFVFDKTRTTNPEGWSVRKDGLLSREQVASDAVGLSAIDRRYSIGASQIVDLRDQLDVEGVAASPVLTNSVVQDGDSGSVTHRERRDQPSVHQAVQSETLIVTDPVSERLQGNLPVPVLVQSADPKPATVASNFNVPKQSGDFLESQAVNREILQVSHGSASDAGLGSGSESRVVRDSGPQIIARRPRKMALYYSCLSHGETLELAARANLQRATNGHEIGCVTLGQRIDFGDWNIVIDRQKSGGTMHYQILAGLERSSADYVFLCESDVFYHESHFEFTPPRDDTFYYNTNVWRVRWEDGHAVRTAGLQQVSGICASRRLLLSHYRRRAEVIEKNGGRFDVKSMAYEPGTRGKFGDEKVANWESPYPNIDITGHGQTLTVPHFSIDSFIEEINVVVVLIPCGDQYRQVVA